MKPIFMCLRPGQIITAITLHQQLNMPHGTKIVIVNAFNDADKIAARFKKTSHNIDYICKDTIEEAIEFIETQLPSDLFIHWDVGLRTQKWLRKLKKKNSGCKIAVYEEGIGTYTQNIYAKFKRVIFGILGLPINVGGSRYVDEIHVYDRQRYIDCAHKTPPSVHEIHRSMSDTLKAQEGSLVKAFITEPEALDAIHNAKETRCEIFLSHSIFNENELLVFQHSDSFKIAKLHPYGKTALSRKDIFAPERSLPAEILLIIACRAFKEVIVYHKGTSATQYISAPNMRYIHVGSP